VQAALDELINDLGTAAVGSSGATRLGIDAAADAPNALPAGSVKSQLAQLLGFLNTHVGASSGAHNAAAIAATPHNNIVTAARTPSGAAPGSGPDCLRAFWLDRLSIVRAGGSPRSPSVSLPRRGP
jgi:hypothetical protein